MKETKIAEENVNWHKPWFKISAKGCPKCSTHKQTCQRWLEFLGIFDWNVARKFDFDDVCKYGDKVTDLKQAIEVYEKNGI